MRRERCDLEERTPGVDQGVDAVAYQQLAALDVASARFGRAPGARALQFRAQGLGERAVMRGVRMEFRVVAPDAGDDAFHRQVRRERRGRAA